MKFKKQSVLLTPSQNAGWCDAVPRLRSVVPASVMPESLDQAVASCSYHNFKD